MLMFGLDWEGQDIAELITLILGFILWIDWGFNWTWVGGPGGGGNELLSGPWTIVWWGAWCGIDDGRGNIWDVWLVVGCAVVGFVSDEGIALDDGIIEDKIIDNNNTIKNHINKLVVIVGEGSVIEPECTPEVAVVGGCGEELVGVGADVALGNRGEEGYWAGFGDEVETVGKDIANKTIIRSILDIRIENKDTNKRSL